MDPANISLTEIPSIPSMPYRDDLTVNTFMPKGGVIIPVSMAIIITSPNHTRSYPKSATIGHMSGVVKSRMDVESRIHPSSIRIAINRRITPTGGIFIPSTMERIRLVTPHMDSVLEYVEAETSRISTLPDVEPADRSVSQNSLKLKRFLKTTIRNAPKAPTPPASVGVKNPHQMPPREIIIRSRIGHGRRTIFQKFSFSYSVRASTSGM